MFLNILKKDLKRKRTMNIILFIFIVMATTFISSSINNLLSISNAMDRYIEKSEVSDLSVYIFNTEDKVKDMNDFLSQNSNVDSVKEESYPYLASNDFSFENNRDFDCTTPLILGTAEGCNYKVFDENNKEIKSVADDEIYMSSLFMDKFDFKFGDTIILNGKNYSKKFTITNTYKDINFNAGMIGMNKFIISYNDYQEIIKSNLFPEFISYGINSENVEELSQELLKSEISTAMTFYHSMIKSMYIMDMITAGVMLLVSIFLIVISIVILRFTIVFTLTEEFREIGVMKAIGITNTKIRGLYCIKYLGMSIVGAVIGTACGLPFGKLLINEVSKNIVIETNINYIVNLLCGLIVISIIMMFCFISTGKLKKVSPIDAIRDGTNGERYKTKGFLKLSKLKMSPVMFLSLNDIFRGLRRFGVLMITFTIGVILIIVPINTANTLSSNELIYWFNMTKSDVYLSDELFDNEIKKEDITSKLEKIKNNLFDNNIPAEVFQEYLFRFNISKGEKSCSATATQNINTDCSDYTYTSGTAPQNNNEIAITHLVSKKIDAKIGDTISIKIFGEPKSFVISAIYQSMLNLGEGIRFYQSFPLDYDNIMGVLAIQIRYTDSPSDHVKGERLEKIQELYPEMMAFTGGDYIADMVGVSIDSLIQLIIIVVLCINALVTVLMVKSFITREKGEIGMLKAIGFSDNTIIKWHTLRIGIIIIISIIIGTILSNPVAQISSGMIFKMMGASSMEFEVRALEVYVIYPLLVLTVTLVASFLTAQQIRKVSASETSNIE